MHFARALFDHHPPFDGIGELVTDQCAVFVVFVCGGDVDVARHSGNRAGRNATGGVAIPQIIIVVATSVRVLRMAVAVGENQFAALDRGIEVEGSWINAAGAF